MDYKITGTNYDGTPIKQPIWESMTADERTAYAKVAFRMIMNIFAKELRFYAHDGMGFYSRG